LVTVLFTPPSKTKFELFVRIICGVPVAAYGIQVISFVTPQAGPFPRDFTVPLPLTVIKFESTLLSDGAIATMPVFCEAVAGIGTVNTGASPIAEFTKVRLMALKSSHI
jgi:hypothetical protein